MLELRFLGGPEIRLGSRSVHLETAKTLGLLAYLAMRPGPHRRDRLANLLWGEQDAAKSARNLRRALWNIRNALETAGAANGCPWLIITRQDVTFNRKCRYNLDVETFGRHLQAARRALRDPKKQVSSSDILSELRACASLHRGDFLEGLHFGDAPEFEMWLIGERAYYREQVLQALSMLSDLHFARGEYDEGVAILHRLLALAPWSEWAHRQLMLGYALAGRRGEALRHFERCKEALQRELGIDPMPETIQLYQRIRNTRSYLSLRSQAPLQDGSGEVLTIPFLGRAEEHARLIQFGQHQVAHGGLTLVKGQAGVGKTRLVLEVLRHLQAQNWQVLHGVCHQFGRAVPFHPIAQGLRQAIQQSPTIFNTLPKVWMTELARLLPELHNQHPNLPPPTPIERDASSRQRFYEAIVQALQLLSQHQRTVFFLDDLHWVDPDTLDMLRHLLFRLQNQPVWFVGAWREESMAAAEMWRSFLRDLRRSRLLEEFTLKPLPAQCLDALTKGLRGLPEQQAHALSNFLYWESQGVPFIFTERIRNLLERKLLWESEDGWRIDDDWLQRAQDYQRRHLLERSSPGPRIPQTVREMILTRIEGLPPSHRPLLNLAAVWGDAFSVEDIALVGETSVPKVADAFSLWIDKGLIQQAQNGAPASYDFTHPILREVIYDQIPFPLRTRLHGAIAQTLETHHAGKLEQALETLAYHYAASLYTDKAIHYLLQAGEAMQARHAHEMAILLFSRAIDLIPEEDQSTLYRAYQLRERVLNRLTRRDEQKQDLDTMESLAQALQDPIRLAETLFRRSEWAMRTAQFREGVTYARKAQDIARKHGAMPQVIDALRMESMCLVRQGQFAAAYKRCQQGLLLSRELQDAHREALCLGSLGVIDLDLDHLEEARQHMEAALNYWRQSKHIWHQAIACNNLSMLYHRMGDLGRALQLQREARSLIPQTGDLGLDAYSLTSLGILQTTLGRYQDAVTSLQQALNLAEVIGDQGLTSYAQHCLGEALLGLGKIEEAEIAFHRALALEKALNVHFHRPFILEGLARCALARKELEFASQLLAKADDYLQKQTYPDSIAIIALHAYIHARLGENHSAQTLLQRFHMELGEASPHWAATPETWWHVSQSFALLGQPDAARDAQIRGKETLLARASSLNDADRHHYLQRPEHQPLLS